MSQEHSYQKKGIKGAFLRCLARYNNTTIPMRVCLAHYRTIAWGSTRNIYEIVNFLFSLDEVEKFDVCEGEEKV